MDSTRAVQLVMVLAGLILFLFGVADLVQHDLVYGAVLVIIGLAVIVLRKEVS